MKARKIKENVYSYPYVDWDRRLFDSLIPLPDGTSYNSYLIKGKDKSVLIDSADPKMQEEFLNNLNSMPKLDYMIANHAEQDHSGLIPVVLEKFPNAKLLSTPKGKNFLMDLLAIPEERFQPVEDGETLDLGGKTLKFIHTPWVHWPETMVTFLQEDRILFSCDFFGSHLAQSDIYAKDLPKVYEAAKRYYAEIMMPFRMMIQKHIEKLAPLDISMIAPSHGPIYQNPSFIIYAYKDWIGDTPKNIVVLPYVSMHGSTKLMVDRLVNKLTEEGVEVQQFDLSATDIGKLAISLVDAATIVIGTPTLHSGPHPVALYAAVLANALKPKAKYVALIGSYGWGEKGTIDKLVATIPNLKVEVLGTVFQKGLPRQATFEAIDQLALTIATKHREMGYKN
jgi:flavorubredoxin